MLRFGTDGVRGVAGTELTPELVTGLGRAAARGLVAPGFVIGRDTRRSGPLLAAALAAGLAAEGVEVVDVGVLPTPGVAALCAARGLAGAVISASHNPFADNGVKLFAAGGLKLTDEVEAAIEAGIGASAEGRQGLELGTVAADTAARDWYARHLVDALGGRRLDGLQVVLDCGNGAASGLAAEVFATAGATVVAVIGDRPDGVNINAGCGATDTTLLSATVVAEGADLGLAFDGDADRVIAVAGDGSVVDGDRLLALFALDRRDGGVVVTVMTNLGFHQAMAAAGIEVATVGVGDRNVLAGLDERGWSLGGEQSGHIVFRDVATTGDGVLSGLLLADLVVRSGSSLGSLAAGVMTRLPQVLRNVRVADRDGLEAADEVWDAVDSASAALAGRGRVLLRPSGTEKLVRVMVEAPSEGEAGAVADALVEVVEASLGVQ